MKEIEQLKNNVKKGDFSNAVKLLLIIWAIITLLPPLDFEIIVAAYISKAVYGISVLQVIMAQYVIAILILLAFVPKYLKKIVR